VVTSEDTHLTELFLFSRQKKFGMESGIKMCENSKHGGMLRSRS